MGILDSLLSQLLVQAPKVIPSAISQSSGSAIGSAIGQGLSQGFGGAIGGSSAPAGQGYSGSSTDVSGVQVDAQPYELGADDQQYGGGFGGAPTLPLANIGAGASPVSTDPTLDPLTVTAPRAQAPADFSSPDTSGLLSTLLSGFSQASLPAGFGQGLDPTLTGGLQSFANITPPTLPQFPNITMPSGITPQQNLMPVNGLQTDQNGGLPKEALLGLGALGAIGGGGGLGGLLKLAGGVVPAIMLMNALKDAGKASTASQGAVNTTTGQLGNVAGQNQNLVQTLTNKTMANLNGNIGSPLKMAIGANVRAAQAAIRQRYSQMGMSGSTAEAQDLQGAAQAGLETQAKIGQDMATQGLNSIAALTSQSIDAYARILAAQTQQGTALGNAQTAFSAAAAQYLGNALGGLLTPAPIQKAA